jgi:hypothetical protein
MSIKGQEIITFRDKDTNFYKYDDSYVYFIWKCQQCKIDRVQAHLNSRFKIFIWSTSKKINHEVDTTKNTELLNIFRNGNCEDTNKNFTGNIVEQEEFYERLPFDCTTKIGEIISKEHTIICNICFEKLSHPILSFNKKRSKHRSGKRSKPPSKKPSKSLSKKSSKRPSKKPSKRRSGKPSKRPSKKHSKRPSKKPSKRRSK